MEETLKKEQSIDTPNEPLQPQELSYFLEEKEPENEGTSSSIVKQERIVRRDHATSPLNLMRDHATSPLNQIPPAAGTDTKDSVDRDAVLARVESQKRLALIKAWEENEKTKVKLDKKKSEYVEVMQNKIAEIHLSAEEKKAMIEAQKGEEIVKVEETAAKFRTRGYEPRRLLGCFGFGVRVFR
ncbi:hypothetical protein TSUD_77190 [Trifolium subterraneum]|uniref:Remorin C-terminal domain-containing protein n=1 Tax=Trifolium subterraneum TaxID=3900 RepID=A0A2Z6MTP3_TRISU|nr:hypothetical protein TSUD_77190 [Trifolium subterraneum]